MELFNKLTLNILKILQQYLINFCSQLRMRFTVPLFIRWNLQLRRKHGEDNDIIVLVK